MLDYEITRLVEYGLVAGRDIRGDELLAKHADWVDELRSRYGSFSADTVDAVLQEECGKVFCRVLEDAGVYKCTPEGREGFRRFVQSL